MSNTRYLEIDSTYRNREQFPNPSKFTVLISQSGIRDKLKALDPVSNATPLVVWTPNDLLTTNGLVVANSNNTSSEFVVSFPTTDNRERLVDYYNGIPLEIDGVIGYRISSWRYLSSDALLDYFNVVINTELATAPAGGTTIHFLDATNFASGYVWIPNSPTVNNYLVSKIVYNNSTNDFRNIISFDGTSKLAGIDIKTPVAWAESQSLSIRTEAPEEVGDLVSGGGNKWNLPSTSNTIAEYYSGSFLRVTDVAPIFTSRIIAYTGSIGNPVRQLTTSDSFNGNVPVGARYEILQFTRDNAVPFTYTGSLVSQQQMVCYEIELINLILPNQTLTVGGRIAFYPFVYVELQNVSGASAGTKNIIYSNNPNASRMLFRAPIDDLQNPLTSPFVKIDGDGMVQTVKFKPNDSFRFAVYLPDGTLFETIVPEYFSPLPANGLNQISAVFSIKRL